ncbi:lipid A export permease/ATP-binding protein MsbA [Neisseria sp. 23W00296]|uniref:lipid A export permease/ATP-binding protein MsbA n=1 Tax=unclassified Neisseria TaxID=2623750 RepID=UPI003757404A
MTEKSFSLFNKQDTQNLRRLLGYMLPYKMRIFWAFLAIVVVAGTESYLAAFIAPLVNQGFVAPEAAPAAGEAGHWYAALADLKNRLNHFIWGSEYKVWAVPAFLIFLVTLRGLGRFVSDYLLSWVGVEAIAHLRRDMFAKMLKLSSKVQQEEPSGNLSGRFLVQAGIAVSNASGVFVTVCRDSLIVAGLVFVLLYLNWQLSLVVVLMFPLLLWLSSYYRKRLKAPQIGAQLTLSELTSVINELHQGHRIVKMFGGYQNALDRFAAVNDNIVRINKKIAQASSARSPVSEFIASVALAVVIFIALWQSRSGTTTIGEFMAFIIAMLQMVAPIKNLANVGIPMQAMFIAADNVCEFLDIPDEADGGSKTIDRAQGRLKFDHINVRYPGQDKKALDDFCLDIAPGEKTALVGSSGSGKTTAVNLLPRFVEAESGRILLDGTDIEELTLDSLRRQFALVSQDVFLFDDSLYNNVLYGRADASEAEVETALKAANLWDFVQQQPQGWHTPVGANGNQLSGGQRQRVSIARAILKDAPILLLDEATSALDNESERLVQQALERLMSNRTSIIVAHRLSTVEQADRIIVMDGGRIIEQGSHAELLEKQGYYAALSRKMPAPE